jgi:hypothetical protein
MVLACTCVDETILQKQRRDGAVCYFELLGTSYGM